MTRYKVKVRATKYLWGGAGLNILQYPLLLTVRIDELGEPVDLKADSDGAGAGGPLGTLEAGQAYTINLQGLRGVSATCVLDTTVYCHLTAPHFAPTTPSSA